MLAARVATGNRTALVTPSTTGVDVAALFGSPAGPIAYTLIVPAGVAVGRQAADTANPSKLLPTLDATGFHADSVGVWIVNGYVLGGGGRGASGGNWDITNGAGGGAGGGAGYPAGTGGDPGDDGVGGGTGVTAGAAGDDTSISGSSPSGGAPGTSVFGALDDRWDVINWGLNLDGTVTGLANELGYTLTGVSTALIESGGDAAITNHDVFVSIGSTGRLWGGGGAGVPGYRNSVLSGENPGDAGTAPGVDQAFTNETGANPFTGGLSGYAIRLTSGASAAVSGFTGSAYLKGTVG